MVMRAQVQRGFGGPEVCSIERIPAPVPGPGEVVVAVRACALNRLDLLQREAPLVRGFALPHVAGMDVAGVVIARAADLPAAVGPALGDAVLVDPVSTCGHCVRCTSGLSPYCEELRTVGSTRHGGLAQQVAVPAASCFPMPTGMGFVEAATLPVAAMTAWHALVTVGQVAAGETVLVNGAGSGVSLAVLQFARAAGATVLGTAGGPGKVRLAMAAGYDHCIDYRAGRVAAEVHARTDGRGADLVIDHVGPALFQQSVEAMAMEGRMVFCGTTTGTEVALALTSVYWWGRALLGAGGYQRREFPEMLAAVTAGVKAPVIDSVWPFERVAEAQARLAAGDFFGKLVIEF
jgi:NADPH:quinone reductase-like Zn-dependent oxidoreductase